MSGCAPGFTPVVFNFATWQVRYPEFSTTVADPNLAQEFFNEAELYLNNTVSTPVKNTTKRALMLNMIVAHIAALNVGTNGSPASPLVGRLSDATQGSVSASTDMGSPVVGSNSYNFFSQTKYGLAYWQAAAPYMLGGRFSIGPQPYFGVTRNFVGVSRV